MQTKNYLYLLPGSQKMCGGSYIGRLNSRMELHSSTDTTLLFVTIFTSIAHTYYIDINCLLSGVSCDRTHPCVCRQRKSDSSSHFFTERMKFMSPHQRNFLLYGRQPCDISLSSVILSSVTHAVFWWCCLCHSRQHENIRFISKAAGTWNVGRKSPKYFLTWKNKITFCWQINTNVVMIPLVSSSFHCCGTPFFFWGRDTLILFFSFLRAWYPYCLAHFIIPQ